jgi:glyoxylase-like metal-dependent hydrolase (beta-lactamase superfamily II)
MTSFVEVADRVHVLRYPVLDVNVTLILGDGTALVVDTLSTDAQAEELLAAVRRVTALPLHVVNTHHHFDHCFGNIVFARTGAPIFAQVEAAALLRTNGHRLRSDWYAEWGPTLPALADVEIHPPDRTVRHSESLDLGGRVVTLTHFGRGHTVGDLVVQVDDADLVVAGDLVEQSGPPSFEDAYPLDWPDTLAALLPASAVVPGHGAIVDRAYVEAQHADLAALAWLIRDGDADGAPAATVAAKAPFDAAHALVAVTRGYHQLAGAG